MTRFTTKHNIHTFDKDWQFPAITEQHAYHRIRDTGGFPDGFTYVAFPWATLIDMLERKSVGLEELRLIFREFREQLPRDTIKITVCQHIKCHNFMYLFRQAGIDHLFWSHAETGSQEISRKHGIQIHPFPLYPVQLASQDETTTNREHLFSFVGAKANQWYMTQSRTWILEHLKDSADGYVVGRDTWHYNKIVYDHQITKKVDKSAELVNSAASEEYTKVLLNTVFSLCPSGTGPNSIRLWESMGCGAIPVVLADTQEFPGNLELWQQGVVFCRETAEDIKALPTRLRKLAADENTLAAMRQGLRQLWMLYGRNTFVYDVQKLVLELFSEKMASHLPAPLSIPSSQHLDQLLEPLTKQTPLSEKDSLFILRTCTSYLLLGSRGIKDQLFSHSPLHTAVGQARVVLGKDHPAVRIINMALHRKSAPESKLAKPYLSSGARPKVFLYGKHSHRTPLAYAPYRQMIGNSLAWAARPEEADLLISGYTLDLRESTKELADLRRKNPTQKVAVISEEPLWDTIWSKGFTSRDRSVGSGATETPFTFLNHQTSDIFAFDKLPYFITTDNKFFLRYNFLFAATAQRTAPEWQALWHKAHQRYAFFAEVRENKAYARGWPDLDVYGLSCYRTEVAQALQGADCITVGQGWSKTAVRQKLIDWHLDKLAALQGQVAIVSGLENTHHKHYISEKIFDAFAVGSIPIYHASPNHHVFEMARPGSFINCFDRSPTQSAKLIREFEPDPEFIEAYQQSHQNLANLFRHPATLLAERQRVTHALLHEIERIC